MDRYSSQRSLSRNVDESPFKSHNTSSQRLSSSFDFASSSDDDVVMKERLNGHLHKHDKEKTVKNNHKSREQLAPDKRLKDERNAGQISYQKEEKIDYEYKGVSEAYAIEEDTRRQSLHSESLEEYADCSQGKYVSPPCRNSEQVKKPVPLPRSRAQKEVPQPSETHEKEVDESHQQTVPVSSSHSLMHPIDKLKYSKIAVDDGSGDSDCVLPQKVERKRKTVLSHAEKQKEIELRNVKTASDIEVDGKEVSSSRKTSFHKSRRKSGEAGVETALMTEESRPTELSYDKIIGIFIHRTEHLQVEPLIQHPLVKVHLLNAATGSYLKKSNFGRPVSFYYENQEVDYILPLMTEMFDYKERR
jgi:hypothetical protein